MTVNNLTRDFGGVFHGAVEICGKEWSFGFCEAGSGVYACLPKLNPAYTYRETIDMGQTQVGMQQVCHILCQPTVPAAGALPVPNGFGS